MGTIDTSFPKGQALADWLFNVGASMTAGQLSIADGRENVQAVNAMLARQMDHHSERLAEEVGAAGATPSSNTYRSTLRSGSPRPRNVVARFSATCTCPSGATGQQSARIHLGRDRQRLPRAAVPKGCQVRELTAQEKAIEFLLFDLTSCVQSDAKTPEPPPLHY